MRKLKFGELVPWQDRVLQVVSDFGDVVRLGTPDDPIYHPELDVPKSDLERAISTLPGLPLYATVKVDGRGAYAIHRRYWSLKQGRVLYDLREWGSKSGHRDEEVAGVEVERLTPMLMDPPSLP